MKYKRKQKQSQVQYFFLNQKIFELDLLFAIPELLASRATWSNSSIKSRNLRREKSLDNRRDGLPILQYIVTCLRTW